MNGKAYVVVDQDGQSVDISIPAGRIQIFYEEGRSRIIISTNQRLNFVLYDMFGGEAELTVIDEDKLPK